VRAAAEFLAESLSAYEMAYRSFREKTAALRHINDVLEQEARRIALLLHDEVGQSLFAAELALTDLEGKIEPSLRPDIRKISSVIGQAGEQMRSLSHEMRPTILDDLGLVPALEFLAQGMSKRSRITVDIRSSVRTRLPPALEVILFRVVQEALTNVVRHSNATRAEVALEQVRGTLVCTVIDAGVGFDAAHPPGGGDGLGLNGIRERLGSVGGTLEIHSQPGTGTQLIITIPQEV
jgi:signal transduction histidine kinase